MIVLRRAALAVLAAAGAAHPGLAQKAASAPGFTLSTAPKIAIIDFGPRTDGGWTQAFEEARV